MMILRGNSVLSERAKDLRSSAQMYRSKRSTGLVMIRLLMLACVGMAGCDLSNVFSDEFLLGLGIDTTLAPTIPTGTVIVTITNNTAVTAEMSFLVKPNGQRVPAGSETTLGTESVLAPGETANRVFDCPVDVVTIGRLGDDGSESAVGAIVFQAAAEGDTTQVEVSYTGSQILSGRDYECGDVVAIRLANQTVTTGETTEAQYRFFIEIIPGL
jgi:hypothetical protein